MAFATDDYLRKMYEQEAMRQYAGSLGALGGLGMQGQGMVPQTDPSNGQKTKAPKPQEPEVNPVLLLLEP